MKISTLKIILNFLVYSSVLYFFSMGILGLFNLPYWGEILLSFLSIFSLDIYLESKGFDLFK